MAELSEQIRDWIAAPRFWHLATVNQDGSPQVSPMWIDVEGDHIVFNTAVGRVKEENLRREPRVSFSCLDNENPYDRVVIHGRVVEFVEGDEADRCMDRLAKKYVGTDRFEWRIPGERRVKVLVEPTRSSHVVGVEPFRRGHRP
ncbi:PPOX class probable F420-dependent enzyme [Amycolatopsis lurida]|uniref:Oxidoreductase n=1 Tax=Amycolatopsis lurida NRRL 2430 TaxID=1460371 RepID=A0A2P2FZL7_AMYLU|nr:PPOX class F420-dependent oxidoreductase [Amycolatopsis lurida]KFU82163.1 oxidoreductase [Amycolatopsis lurida NRRL 2430]SEC48184.1 PPOX class probable F420-dependent enzyme [Amycolatopsis lurida]